MSDMSQVIIAKSDQINAGDLVGISRTIRVASVNVIPGEDQPVLIKVDGDKKAYKPCKSMCRVLVAAWGADSAKYAGRSMTLYNDPDVLWAGMKVGGIRISHMSHIDSPITLALAENKKNRKLFTVKPLQTQRADTPAVASPPATAAETPLIDAGQSAGAASTDRITAYCETVMDAINAAETVADLDAIEGKAATKLANHANQLAYIRAAVEFKLPFLAAQGDDGFGTNAGARVTA
jgi:hypothetical protein